MNGDENLEVDKAEENQGVLITCEWAGRPGSVMLLVRTRAEVFSRMRLDCPSNPEISTRSVPHEAVIDPKLQAKIQLVIG